MNYIKGDLIQLFKEGQFDSIAHQCNCFKMGAGIAGKLVDEFPNLKQIAQGDPELLPGTYRTLQTPYGNIFNLFSQYKPGSCRMTGLDSFDIRKAYLKECIFELDMSENPQHLGIPLIASGIAADPTLKIEGDDLGYFKYYIADLFKPLEASGWQITVVVYE